MQHQVAPDPNASGHQSFELWFEWNSTKLRQDDEVDSILQLASVIKAVREHLRSGALVELVPGKSMPVPLYWQHTRLQVPMLGRLTRAVVQTARKMLS